MAAIHHAAVALMEDRARLDVGASVKPVRLEQSRHARALAQHNQVGSALPRQLRCNNWPVSWPGFAWATTIHMRSTRSRNA